MDGDSDVEKDLDNSLLDPHHALDSSTEEGENPDDTLADCGEYKEDGATGTAINGHHVGMLEEMVQEMKQGFQSAIEELAKIQDKEDGGYSKQLQQQQQRQLDKLTDSVHGIKEQLSTLVKAVEQVQGENKKLKEDFGALRAEVRRKGAGPEEHLMIPVDSSVEWAEEGTHNPFENGDSHNSPTEFDEGEQNGEKSGDHDEVTAIACKSLSLTQALGEKFMEFNMSASSEDGEEPNGRRVSSITPKTNTLPEESNRRHSMPESATAITRNKQMARAAQRQAAVKELADSERDYCSQLWALLDTYLTPLQTASFLSGEQLDLLFPPFLERMYMEHCMICSGLQDKLVHWSYMGSIANLLSRVTESHNADSLLSLYFEYAEYLPDAITCLRETLMHSTDFRSFLKTIQQSSCQTDDLMTLIIAPVQHLPKYLLQLQQICKHTPSTHPDYLLLQTSLTRLRSFVEQINERVNSAMTVRTAMSQDSRTGSSNDSSQVLSARDSGVHSNEEELPTPRNFFRSEQNLSPEEWQEDVYYSQRQPHQRSSSFYHDHWNRIDDQRKLASQLSAYSQPDLTRFDIFGGLSLYNPPGQFSHMPRSQSGRPPSGANQSWGNSRDSAINNQKFKLRQSHGPPTAFQAGDSPHLLPSPRSRPSSAIDFTNGHQHHFHQLDFGTNQTRSRSAMGPLDPNHRPTIISRKHGRRSQPPVSNSGFWQDGSSTSHHKLPQTKMAVPPLDLLPSRPSPLPTHISLEDDEEDDTRASDSHSFGTSGGSHRQSSSRCSHDDHELDLDLHQELSELDHDHGQESRASEFSEEDVAASLAWKLCVDSSEKENTDAMYEHHHLKDSPNNPQQTNEVFHLNHDTLDKKLSLKGDTNNDRSHKVEERNGTGLYIKRTQSKGLESRKSVPLQSSMLSEGNKSSTNSENGVLLSSEEISVSSDYNKATASRHDSFPKEDDVSSSSSASNKVVLSHSKSLDSESNGVSRISSGSNSDSFSHKKEHQHSPRNFENVEEGKNAVEHNRQFLLTLAQSPSRSLSKEATSLKKKSVFSSTAEISLKNSGPEEVKKKKVETMFTVNDSSSGTSDPQNESPIVRTSASSSSRDKIIRRSAPPENSHIPNGFQGLDSKAMIRTSSPYTRHKSLSTSGSNMKELDSKGDISSSSASESLDKPKGGNTTKILETAIDDNVNSIRNEEDCHGNQKNQPEGKLTRSVDMSDLFITDDSKDKRRDKKKSKDSGIYHSSDNLPKANDDPVGARKKMHLKSSIKNLFTKKRGRVILADMEREVILEMAKESLKTRKMPPSSAILLTSSPSSTYNESQDAKSVMAPGISDCRRRIQNNPENRSTIDALEITRKTHPIKPAESAVRMQQLNSSSPMSHVETGKRNKLEPNALNQSKSWYDFLPFSQKRPLTVEHSSRFKKPQPSSSSNMCTQKNIVPDEKPAGSSHESDRCGSSDMQKTCGSNVFNDQNLPSKPVEKRTSSSDFPANCAYHLDVPPEASQKGTNLTKEELKSQNLEEFSQQQRRKFHEQIKKYTKLKQKGKNIEQPVLENQVNEKIRDKGLRTRTNKHKDKLNGNDRKVSPLNQCSNCQMKAKKFSLLEQVKEEQVNTTMNTASDKKNRNRDHQRTAGEMPVLSGTTSNDSNSQQIESPVSQNGLCMPSNEEMYVTFSHCLKAPEHNVPHENGRSHTSLSSNPTSQELKDDKKIDVKEMKPKAAKSNPCPKSDNVSHDVNMTSGAPSCPKLLEKSVQDSGSLSSSVQSSFSLAASKLLQNGEVSLSSHLSHSSTNKLSNPFYGMNGLNGLTFSGSPLCYNGANLSRKNNGNMKETRLNSHELNISGSNGPIVHESVKRSNGGEYNNLSLDVQVNSLQAESIQKSYDKRVPWHGGNITSYSLLPHEKFQESSSNHLSHPLYEGTENQNVPKENSQFFTNKLDIAANSKALTMSSNPTIIIQPPPKASDLSKQEAKFHVEKEDQADKRQTLNGDEEENWQELLTASHDYFDSKYRLCYDADYQEGKNSTPPPALDDPSLTRSSAPSSLVTTIDNSAYVTFVSCPTISTTTQEKNKSSFWRDFPSFADGKKLPNGTVTHPALFMPRITPTSGAQVKSFNESASQLANSKIVGSIDCSLNKAANTFAGSKGSDTQVISMHTHPMHSQAQNPCNSTTGRKINGDLENRNPAKLMTNHIISSISVGNGSKAPVSPTTANQIYLPMSLANGTRAQGGPSTHEISTSLSIANGNKASSVTKNIDYSKSVSSSFMINPACVAPSSKLNNFNATLPAQKEPYSFTVPHRPHIKDNFDTNKENPIRPTSLSPDHPEISSAPQSLQKLFPSKLNDRGNQLLGAQFKGSIEKGSSADSIKRSNENDTIQTGDTRRSFAGDHSFLSNHLTTSHCSSFNNSFPKHLSYPFHERYSSTLSDTDTNDRLYVNSPMGQTTDDKIKCNGKTSHKPGSEPNTTSNVFCVLPFGEYTVDNSVQQVPKRFSQFNLETHKQPQSSQHDHAALTKDPKMFAIHRREAKNIIRPNETCRYSSCSSHSANEIQILKLPDAEDTSYQPNIKNCSRALESHSESAECEKSKKTSNALQVRYTPKTGFRRKKMVDMSPPSSVNSFLPTHGMPNNMSFSGGPVSASQHNNVSDTCNTGHGEMSSISEYANEVAAGVSSSVGPDLLQVSSAKQGSSHKPDSSPTHTPARQSRQMPTSQSPDSLTPPRPSPTTGAQQKKQSFLARLAHSPLSFLHRDSKNTTESK